VAKEKRRSWLDKISKWILGALPAEEASPSPPKANRTDPAPQAEPERRAAFNTPTVRPLPSGTESIRSEPKESASADKSPWQTPKQYIDAEKPQVLADSDQTAKTINRAWKAFEVAWADAGLSDHYFLEQEELQNTLALLDQSFEDELIEWLFQLCTKPEALRDLAGIIERGQVKPTDNIDAIRAFAYVSVAVSAKPRPSSVQASPDHIGPEKELEPPAQRKAVKSITETPTTSPSKTEPPALTTGFTPEADQGEFLTHEANEGSLRSGANTRPIGNIYIKELELSIRSYNCLKRADIHTLLDLAGKTEEGLIEIKNFGQKSADEVRRALERRGLSLPFRSEDVLGLSTRDSAIPDQAVHSRSQDDDSLRSLGLSARSLNSLYRGQIDNIPHLLQHTEADLLAIPNFGSTAIQEIKASLGERGRSLLSERTQWQAKTEALLEQQQEQDDLEEAWQNLRLLIGRQNGLSNPGFEKLVLFCSGYRDDPAAKHLTDILVPLKASLEFIGESLIREHRDHTESVQNALTILRDWIASQLLQQSSDAALQWVHQITKSFGPSQERNWLVYLLRCSGQTLKAIGDTLTPPVSRERARQMEAKITKIIGIPSAELAERVEQLEEAALLKNEREAIQTWLEQLGRLPVPEDPRDNETGQQSLWDHICGMDLKRRSELFKKHSLSITDAEYDFHYQYVVARGSVGPGYWRDFENLKQFVIRHAIALGEPELMPKQTTFPDSIRGVVTSYGGQSKVAKRLGLKYQGQLVGTEGGRRYWSDERLNQLLLDTNHHHLNDPDLMSSYGDILEFFSDTEITEYQEKKPHSAIAALTKMGTLHWSEVAARFGKRFVSGESQKSVTLSYIKAFVRDLGEHLDSLSPSELFVLFQAQGINKGDKEKFSRTFDALVDAVQSGVVDKEELRSWAENNEVESISELLELGAELKAESSTEEKEQKLLERRSKKLMQKFPQQDADAEVQVADLPTLEPVKILKALDKAADIVENSGNDSDKVEFLKAKAAAKLWDACFKDEEDLIRKLKAFPAEADSYSQEVQQAFIEEYEGARALPIPDAYAFRDLRGNPRDPKLMQRLVAFRLERDFRLLNLSGTGTGKTLSAIYAALICGCQRLLISCPNGVIQSWRRAFSSAFPTANLIIKPEGWELGDLSDGVNVVIVNHERFQDQFAQQLLGFCVNYQADLIVIDEIHQSKRRSSDQSSQRRKLMNEFIRISSNINTDLRVLGLSATPVINNLYEGRSLLELICQEPIDDVEERIDLNSCMNLYQHFVVHGIRMNPGQLSRTNLIYQDIDATSLLPQIIWATKKGTYHDIEQLLVEPKLKSLDRCLVRGEKTVIFVTYIKNTLRPITNWLAQNHYTFSVYTGDEKDAQEEGFNDSLDEFIRGNTDVLVASVQCAGTGVDGLQTVCNRAVFFQLPWTSTEFEQTIGRLDRDGTDFDHIDVYVPLTDVALPDGERWSWCRSKLDRIESKRDIAKAAVDGEIPDAATLISPSEASKYWLNWLEKLEQQSQTISSPK
jgi:superfamily II DNA or RNA helicase